MTLDVRRDTDGTARARLDARLARPRAQGLDVITTLEHFAIVSYLVPVDRLRPHVDPQFEVVPFRERGETCGLVSVVPFVVVDFRFARLPFLRFRFAQTNYRLYVTDRRGDHLAWFFGTSLDTVWVAVPHHVWKLPWYRARTRFDASYAHADGRYARYRFATRSRWAPAEASLVDRGTPMPLLPGFADMDAQRLVLTNPVRGVFLRRDGRVGTYSIWHPEMQLTSGDVEHARFGLLERLGLLDGAQMKRAHSVLFTPRIEFQIRLPPTEYAARGDG
ncbi:MAG TPA: DUF2071 domain-containing protein [Polyangiaceae bacterium]